MAFDYSGINETAQTLIADFGRTAILRQRSSTLIDPAQPSRGYNTGNVDLTVNIANVNFTKSDFENTAIEDGDLKFVMSALDAPGIEIGTDDLIVDGSKQYQIVNAKKVRPGPTTLVWFLQVR